MQMYQSWSLRIISSIMVVGNGCHLGPFHLFQGISVAEWSIVV